MDNRLVVWRVHGILFAVNKSSTLLGVGAVGAFVSFLVFLFFFLLNVGLFVQYADRFRSFFFEGGGGGIVLLIITLLPLFGLYAYAEMKELTVFKKVTLVVFALVILIRLFAITDTFGELASSFSLNSIPQFLFFSAPNIVYIALFAVGLYFAGRSGSKLFKWGMILGLISPVLFVINGVASRFLFSYYYQNDVVTRSEIIFSYIFSASAVIEPILLIITYFLLGMLFVKARKLNQ